MYFKLGDYRAAKSECQKELAADPESQGLKDLYFKVLAEIGEIKEAISIIKTYPCYERVENFYDLSLIEGLAWGVLSNVSNTSESMELMSMVGAIFTRDSRAVEVILKHLDSRNALLRAHAINAATMYRDDVLKSRLKEQLHKEKNYFVRLELIKGVGALQMKECQGQLKEVIGSPRSTDEEKYAAIASLVSIYDKIGRVEFYEMIGSSRAGLRHAGCEIALHLEEKRYLPEVFTLLDDSSPAVQLSALNVLAILGYEGVDRSQLCTKIEEMIGSANPAISLTAEWVKVRHDLPIDKSSILRWIHHENQKVRVDAAAALSMYGDGMLSEMLMGIRNHSDPFVRLNLALGLLRHHIHVDQALSEIHSILMDSSVKLMETAYSNPFFVSIGPSEVRHVPLIPQYPNIVNQLVRLELINTLTIFEYEGAREMIKTLLSQKKWQLIGSAASLLIEEGELESLDLVKDLLEDSDPAVATQAALVLAYLGKDPSVAPILEGLYAKADWDMKIQILEALGRIGEKEAVPFLIRALDEPFQLLKIVSASALIQCLYH